MKVLDNLSLPVLVASERARQSPWCRSVARLSLVLTLLCFGRGARSAAAIDRQAPVAGLSLSEVLRLVQESAPEAAVALAQIDVAQADVRTARMLPNPGLTVAGAMAEPIFSAAIQIHLPIFGQRGARVRAAERGADQVRAESALSIWRLRHDARVVYYNAVRAQEEVTIAEQVEVLTARVVAISTERLDNGVGTRLERDQAALVHARAQQDVSDRQATARAARIDLARVLGAADAEVQPLAESLATIGPTPAEQGLTDQARARHPELLALTAERAAALSRAQAARAERRPVPTLELGLDLLEHATCVGDTHGSVSGPRCLGPRGALSFDLPVLNLNGGPIARAQAEAALAQRRLQAAMVRVQSGVAAAYTGFTAATVRARFFKDYYVPAANSVEQMAREGFAAGRTGILPLLEAERAVLEARLGRAEALFAVQVARADLEEASGVTLSAP